jgi:hypothetical protein
MSRSDVENSRALASTAFWRWHIVTGALLNGVMECIEARKFSDIWF